MFFENIDKPERSGLEVRWSGSFHYGFFSIIVGETNDLPSLEIGNSVFLNRPGGLLAQHSVISTSPIILNGTFSTVQIDNSLVTRTGVQIGFSGRNIYTSSDYMENTPFEGSLFIQDARLEDYNFRINEQITIPLEYNNEELVIAIIPEANTYALILGMIIGVSIVFRRKRPARKCNKIFENIESFKENALMLFTDLVLTNK